MKKKVLVFAGYYFPSVKGGGAIQSLSNLINILIDKFDFYVLADDRDLGDEQHFNNIITDEWIQVGKANVWYTNTKELTFSSLSKIINNLDYDVLYLNSFFSYNISMIIIILNKLNRISRKPIILAPRGQFTQGALGFKNIKKTVYITIAKVLGLYRDITWHATSEIEKSDIKAIFGNNVNIKVAKNLTADYRNFKYDKIIEKNPGELKIVFVSRIHPMKNLMQAIALVRKVIGNVEFNIHGPIEDKSYWAECEKVISSLSANVKVVYKGVIDHDQIISMFKKHHVFLFPTLGENFGHVISEALIGGCPVIISDQTPWRGLKELNVGWDIALRDEEKFSKILQHCIDMSKEEYESLSMSAFEYGRKQSNQEDDIMKTYELFVHDTTVLGGKN